MTTAQQIGTVLLLALVLAPIVAINWRWWAKGIYEWHHHGGRMRRKMRDGRFEYRTETKDDFWDRIDRSAW